MHGMYVKINNNVFAASPINARGTIPGLLLFHYKPQGDITFAAIPVQAHGMITCLPLLWYNIMFGAILVQDCGTLQCLLLLQQKTHGTIFSLCSSK